MRPVIIGIVIIFGILVLALILFFILLLFSFLFLSLASNLSDHHTATVKSSSSVSYRRRYHRHNHHGHSSSSSLLSLLSSLIIFLLFMLSFLLFVLLLLLLLSISLLVFIVLIVIFIIIIIIIITSTDRRKLCILPRFFACRLVVLREKERIDFPEISSIGWKWTTKNSATFRRRLFHAWLELFIVLRSQN